MESIIDMTPSVALMKSSFFTILAAGSLPFLFFAGRWAWTRLEGLRGDAGASESGRKMFDGVPSVIGKDPSSSMSV